MLVVWLRLPVGNAVHAQDLFDLIANLNLSTVTDELGWGSPFPDLIFQCIDELSVGLH